MTITEAFYAAIEYKKQKGGHEGKPAEVKTIRNYLTTLNSILSVIPDIPISLLSSNHIEMWKDRMASNGMARSSMAGYISCLRSVLAYLRAEMGMDVLDPWSVKRIRVKRRPNRVWLLPEEIQTMRMAATNPRDRSMVSLLYSLGCRPYEMLNLNRSDVTTDEVIIRNEKTGNDYPVFIAPYARADLDAYLKTRTDKLSPLYISGQRRRLTVQRLEQIFHEVADRAKQLYPDVWQSDKNVTPYVFRHTHATDLRINGASLIDIRDALGHETITSTQIYSHIPDSHRREVRNRYHTRL